MRSSISVFSALLVLGCGGESVIGGANGGAGGDGGTGGTGGSGALNGSGAMGGSGGGDPVPSMGGASAAGTGNVSPGGAGFAGFSSGSGGTGLPDGYVPLCDLQVALSKSCARAGCHNTLDRYADLELTNLSAVPAQLIDQPATHGDINCAPPGMPFRECTPAELPAACPPNALLVDSANPEESWILKKLRGDTGCGDQMPLPPGNSTASGWNDARLACLEDWIYELAGRAGSRADDP
jgi:hypothetical protein